MGLNSRPDYVRWYKTASWYRLRRKALSREPLCRFCKKKGIVTPGNTVDHIEAHKGNMSKFFSLSNLQVLCKQCHSSTKQRLEKSGEFGCDENGFVEAWK